MLRSNKTERNKSERREERVKRRMAHGNMAPTFADYDVTDPSIATAYM